MSLLERTRQIVRADRKAPVGARLRLRAVAHGALAALASLGLCCLPVLVAWGAEGTSTTSWTSALGIGADAFVLAHGGTVVAGSDPVAFLALFLAAVPLLVTTVSCRWLLARLARRPDATRGAWWRCPAAQEVGLLVGGYAVTGVLIALIAGWGPAEPFLPSVLPGAVLMPLVALAVAMARQQRAGGAVLTDAVARWLRRVTPSVLSRALRPALFGLLSLLGAGLALVVLMVVLQLGRVSQLYDVLGAGAVGTVVLSLAQLLALPNLVVWAVAWMVGPGFAVGDVTVSWSHVGDGVLPLVPVLGVLPEPGALPAGLWLSALVPLGAGALIGWRCVRRTTRLAGWRSRAEPAAVACLLVALVLGLLAWLSGGSLGSAHLAHLGVSPLPVAGALVGELLAGAMGCVTVLHWRRTRR